MGIIFWVACNVVSLSISVYCEMANASIRLVLYHRLQFSHFTSVIMYIIQPREFCLGILESKKDTYHSNLVSTLPLDIGKVGYILRFDSINN